jgi:hypothetical protein
MSTPTKRHQITGIQLVKLGRELTNMDAALMATMTCDELAVHLSTTLGFEIKCTNLRYAARAHDITLAVKGAHRAKATKFNKTDRLRRLAGIVSDLYISLGQPQPVELKKLLTGAK